jgi:hypothetical protein
MVGIRGVDEVLKSFEGLEHIPGSKQKRREDSPAAEKRRRKAAGETNGWDANPIIKTLKGEEVEVFTIGALANALEKKIVTVRLWEKKGYIPVAPYRLRSKSLNGQKVNGNRVYTRDLIEITIAEFEKRGIMGAARVEWKDHADLPGVLAQLWREAL